MKSENISLQSYIVKEFYIYEYEQRWFLGNNWMHPEKCKWSNKEWSEDLTPRKYPPKGWTWISDWQYSVEEDTDS